MFWLSNIATKSNENSLKREKKNVVKSILRRKNVNASDLQNFALKMKTQRKSTIW
jgi:hypothetical protein